jgi:hypothetical protein
MLMSFITSRNKKILAGLSLITTLSIISIQLHASTPVTTPAAPVTPPPPSPVSDTAGQGLLAQIAQYTNGTLTAVTSTTNPVVTAIVTALTNLTSPDMATNPASPTPNLQSSFTTYASSSAASQAAQLTVQQTALTPVVANFTTTSVPNANDLAFASLLGTPTPIFNPDPRASASSIDSGMNYLAFAAGLLIPHAVPTSTWKGALPYQTAYIRYFGTVTAVETYNAYVLSQLYEDAKNGVSTAQTTLVNQASDPANWFAIITNESIGAVLRQMLMYQSQSYIVLTQILQTQKMILAGTAMSNTTAMLAGMANEQMLVSKAIQ